MNNYLTVVTDQPKQVCLFNAPRPLEGDPADIGLNGFTIRLTDEHPGAFERNRRLDAKGVRMVTREQAATWSREMLQAEYGIEATDVYTWPELVQHYVAHHEPCK